MTAAIEKKGEEKAKPEIEIARWFSFQARHRIVANLKALDKHKDAEATAISDAVYEAAATPSTSGAGRCGLGGLVRGLPAGDASTPLPVFAIPVPTPFPVGPVNVHLIARARSPFDTGPLTDTPGRCAAAWPRVSRVPGRGR